MPKARREHGLRAIEAARKALAAQTAAGNDPRRSADVNRARGEAISEGHRRNRSWAREHPGQRDEAWFKREIAPKLDAFTLEEIAKADGIIARGLLAHPSRCEGAASAGTGIACSRWSKPGTEPHRRTSLAVDPLRGSGSAENEELWSWHVRPKRGVALALLAGAGDRNCRSATGASRRRSCPLRAEQKRVRTSPARSKRSSCRPGSHE